MAAELKIRRTDARARLPRRMSAGAAGLDVYACLDSDQVLRVPPGGRTLIPTGLQLAVPVGYEVQLRPRSGLALKHGVTLPNSPGTIDSDYRGDLGVILMNLGTEPFEIRDGDRIAQMVVAAVSMVVPIEVDELPPTSRGDGGFGSTGV